MTRVRSTHFKDLPEKLDTLADSLEPWAREWTQKRHHEDHIPAVWQFENVQERYCMVSRVRSEMRRAQVLEDLTLIFRVGVDWQGLHEDWEPV